MSKSFSRYSPKNKIRVSRWVRQYNRYSKIFLSMVNKFKSIIQNTNE